MKEKVNSPVLTKAEVGISDGVLASELVGMDSVLPTNVLPVEDGMEDVDVVLSVVADGRDSEVEKPVLIVPVLPSVVVDVDGILVIVLELSVTTPVIEVGDGTLPDVRVDSSVSVSRLEAPVVDLVDTESVLSVVGAGLDVWVSVLPLMLEDSLDVSDKTVVVVAVSVAGLPKELAVASVVCEKVVSDSVLPVCILEDRVLVLRVSVKPVLVSILDDVILSLVGEAVVLVDSDEL